MTMTIERMTENDLDGVALTLYKFKCQLNLKIP